MHAAMGSPLGKRCKTCEIGERNHWIWKSARRAASGQEDTVHRRVVRVGEELTFGSRTNRVFGAISSVPNQQSRVAAMLGSAVDMSYTYSTCCKAETRVFVLFTR